MNMSVDNVMAAHLRMKELEEFMCYPNEAGKSYQNYLATLKSDYFIKGVQFTLDYIKENCQ